MKTAFLFLIFLSACATAHASPTDEFPLAKGTSWTYAGTVTTAKGTEPIRWTLRIADMRADKERDVIRVEGDLTQLAFWEPGRAPKESVWIRRGAKLGRALGEAGSESPWLEWPLEQGKKFCDPDDARLCWVVEKAETVNYEGASRRSWELRQRDNTGTQTMQVVAGVGIVAYSYRHHGSPADVDVKLVSGGRPGRP